MSYSVVIEVPVEDITPRDIVDEDGTEDRIEANIKSVRKVSDHKGGTAEYVIYTRSRKIYRYFPGEKVKIRIKLSDLLEDL